MTTFLVTGATSGPGRPLVARLRAGGHDVRALSRRPGDGTHVGDLSTGAGIAEALAGVDTVVHLASNLRRDLPDTERLLGLARAAGVGHLVFLSIVGVDRIPYGYYVDKVASERAIAASGIPFTILRATQFHSFPLTVLRMTGGHVFVKGVSIQPIGVVDVATRLAELATGEPAGRVADLGGPEILDATDVLHRLQAAGRASRRVLSITIPGTTFRAFRAGHHLAGLPGAGTQTFDAWLASGAEK
ncbi:SDR family oxidoreductase [Pseudolysinimonas sp.]